MRGYVRLLQKNPEPELSVEKGVKTPIETSETPIVTALQAQPEALQERLSEIVTITIRDPSPVRISLRNLLELVFYISPYRSAHVSRFLAEVSSRRSEHLCARFSERATQFQSREETELRVAELGLSICD